MCGSIGFHRLLDGRYICKKTQAMTIDIEQPQPSAYKDIDHATIESGFTMASDSQTCSLLRTLAASKPAGRFLELGTGTGLSTSWILDGMDKDSTLVSVDNAPEFLAIARQWLGADSRLTLVESDGAAWMEQNSHEKFDYIFADTWHGKYLMLDEALGMLNHGGFYILDDMLPQPNWPDGHQEKALRLLQTLEAREDLLLTSQAWATGIIIGVKRS
jgi:predicted O-methyltransferase YrrM